MIILGVQIEVWVVVIESIIAKFVSISSMSSEDGEDDG